MDLDRTVAGTNVGVAMAFDAKHRVARRWEQTRRRFLRANDLEKRASAEGLERQVAALAVSNPEYVVVGA